MKRTRVLTGVTSVLAAGVLVAACGSSGGSGRAKSADSGKVTAGNAWTREITTPSGDAAIYLKVTNGTDNAVKITGVSVPGSVASSASLHESMMTDATSSTTTGDTSSTTMAGDTTTTTAAGYGQMTMQPLDSVTVAAHRTVRFAPGGKHIMLEGVKQALSAGDTFTLTLQLDAGRNLRTTVTVRST